MRALSIGSLREVLHVDWQVSDSSLSRLDWGDVYRHQLSRGWGLLVYKPWYHYQEGVTKIKLPGTGIRDQIENPMNNQGPRRRPSEQSEIRERADPYTPHCPGSHVAPRRTLTSFCDLLPTLWPLDSVSEWANPTLASFDNVDILKLYLNNTLLLCVWVLIHTT